MCSAQMNIYIYIWMYRLGFGMNWCDKVRARENRPRFENASILYAFEM